MSHISHDSHVGMHKNTLSFHMGRPYYYAPKYTVGFVITMTFYLIFFTIGLWVWVEVCIAWLGSSKPCLVWEIPRHLSWTSRLPAGTTCITLFGWWPRLPSGRWHHRPMWLGGGCRPFQAMASDRLTYVKQRRSPISGNGHISPDVIREIVIVRYGRWTVSPNIL